MLCLLEQYGCSVCYDSPAVNFVEVAIEVVMI